jgi:hypothetical protein
MTITADFRAVVVEGAELIEHAMHDGLLARDLGLCSDAEVETAIVAVRLLAGRVPGGLAALIADDYVDSPECFCRRMKAALWRACQLNHVESEYAALTAQNGEQHV